MDTILYPPGLNHADMHKSTGDMPLEEITLSEIILLGRFTSMTLAGDYIDIDASYAYSELMEVRAQLSSWAGCGNEFHMLYTRLSANVSNNVGSLGGVHFVSRAEEAIDLFLLRGGAIEVHARGAGQTISWLRGAEVVLGSQSGDDPTLNVEHVRVLNVESQLTTDVAPTTDNVLLWFETDSASAIGISNLHEIRMAKGNRIFSGVGAPNNAVEPFASAPEGSLYLRSDPTSKDETLYTKHDTTWTAVTHA